MKTRCRCPFCDRELAMSCFEPVFCDGCKIELIVCPKCGKVYNKKMDRCPHCPAEETD